VERISFSRTHPYPASCVEVPIELKLASLKPIRLNAAVDTGSAFCIFQREYGEQLNLSIESGIPETVRTADGGVIEIFGHYVMMTCLDWTFDSLVYFAKQASFRRNVVGRSGWLEKFKLGLIHHDGLLLLGHYDD
jgi:hypothetical protein